MTPEEKLLRAIFGEKASDVRDTSLRVPPGGMGTVVEVRVFNRRGVDKDERALAIERDEIERLAKDRDDERAIIERNMYDRVRALLLNRIAARGPKGVTANSKITGKVLDSLSRGQWWQIVPASEPIMTRLEVLKEEFDDNIGRIQGRFESKVEKLQRGDELPPGVLKMVKVFVAVKRKMQPGDKMAGRHGNKGVVLQHRAGRGHALPGGRHQRRHRAEPPRRAVQDECRPDSRDPPGVGLPRARPQDRRDSGQGRRWLVQRSAAGPAGRGLRRRPRGRRADRDDVGSGSDGGRRDQPERHPDGEPRV